MHAVPPIDLPVSIACTPHGPGGAATHARAHPAAVAHASGTRRWDAGGDEHIADGGDHGGIVAGLSHPGVTEHAWKGSRDSAGDAPQNRRAERIAAAEAA
jgi:glutamate-1-semialdehyde aminotransferase